MKCIAYGPVGEVRLRESQPSFRVPPGIGEQRARGSSSKVGGGDLLAAANVFTGAKERDRAGYDATVHRPAYATEERTVPRLRA